ncbi:protein kinase domain-containing protein [Tuwongella immobilis]|uniref:Protein kinase domain-containing protein n=1 Tax=Tuwongella immobilis TaxID=692036 RepID=A0A6C2YKG2_9BACT|nr:serine/threonine-protein kinase [Tuwongella immobilis]VIP01791.1 serine threonine protein kinase : Serine/threonine protein kinase OS=Singulisphaera acidiphila (strain ATCC BAA-1392 / DSM 18658 / VKM B-2454 / MOB10) GN=Sinac_5215 PE=3 SV=1: Pkinase: TPR_11: TPR_1: TPR_2 [Tuwongella immobilis]VTR99460.1 serine threonine protein kinase : Serine/threonine protein kinase OS=Singulisphaera acidiphila (strain ATCC BAA-1392 / DSM 18658 / VKM B-2454 / MOB10) GN=Sinac_5215 PE=3 SV=1: Pkinase: TPR_11: T
MRSHSVSNSTGETPFDESVVDTSAVQLEGAWRNFFAMRTTSPTDESAPTSPPIGESAIPDWREYLRGSGETRRQCGIRLACIDLERRWQLRQDWLVEQYFASEREWATDPEAITRLIHAEVAAKRARNLHCEVADYAARFPQLPIDQLHDAIESTDAPLIPNYRIEKRLGRGGMGDVYLAFESRLQRPVALKVLRAGINWQHAAQQRFRQEAIAAAKLHHPNIAPVFEADSHQGILYYTMEYCPAGSLMNRVANGGKLAPREATEWIVQACKGVAAAHAAGLIHRDLKPDNVLIGSDGAPKVADFGLVRQLQTDRPLTVEHSLLGSPGYLAPEQASGQAHQAGPPADVYGMGATLYRLVCGRAPFEGTDLLQVLRDVAAIDPIPPRRLAAEIPEELQTILLKALEKSPQARYPRIEAFADDLQRFLDNRPILARPIGPIGRTIKWTRRNPLAAFWLGVSVVTLLVATVVSLRFAWIANEQAALASERALREEQERIAAVTAKQAAEIAQLAEEKQRKAAEQAAESAQQAQIAEKLQRKAAEQARDRLRETLDATLNLDSLINLVKQPELTPEQQQFLGRMLTYYREVAGDQNNDPDVQLRIAEAGLKVGYLESLLGRYRESEIAFTDAISRLEALLPSAVDPTTYRVLLITGYRQRSLIRANQSPKLARLDQQAALGHIAPLGMQPQLSEAFAAVIVDLLTIVAEQHLLDREYDECQQRLRQIEQLIRQQSKTNPNSPNLIIYQAIANSLEGLLLSITKDFQSSQKKHLQAIALLEELSVTDPTDPPIRAALGDSLFQFALSLQQHNRHQEAIDRFSASIRIYQELLRENPLMVDYRYSLANNYIERVTSHLDRGDLQSLQNDLRQARTLVDELRKQSPNRLEYQRLSLRVDAEQWLLRPQVTENSTFMAIDRFWRDHIDPLLAPKASDADQRWQEARAAAQLAIRLREQGKYAQAIEQFTKALKALDESSEKGRNYERGCLYYERGLARADAKQHAAAILDFTDALKVQLPLVANESAEISYRLAVAWSFNDRGLAYEAQQEDELAEQDYREAIRRFQAIVQQSPNADHFRGLGASLCNLGNLLRLDKPAESLEWYTQAVNALTRVYRQNAEDATAAQFLRNAYWGRARAYQAVGNYPAAIEAWDAAISLDTDDEWLTFRQQKAYCLLKLGQADAAIAEISAVSRRPDFWNWHYVEFAWIFSLASQSDPKSAPIRIERGLQLIRMALERGYTNLPNLRNHPDFAPLRAHPQFEAILTQTKAKPTKANNSKK